MKIVLDLEKSMNNHCWKEIGLSLKSYVELMLETLWKLYDNSGDLAEDEEQYVDLDDEYRLRLYDMLDMFSTFKIIGDDENENK